MRILVGPCLTLVLVLALARCAGQSAPSIPAPQRASPVENALAGPDAASGIAEFPVPGLLDTGIAPDLAGNEWTGSSGTLLRFNESTHAVTAFDLPNPNDDAQSLALSPDRSSMWFTLPHTSVVGYMNLSNHHAHEFATPTHNSWAWGIAAGPDHAMWFTEPKSPQLGHNQTGKIGRIDLSTFAIAEYKLPAHLQPLAIALGSDGALWFTASSFSPAEGYIGRITRSGHITDYSIGANTPHAIAPGPDGAIWFAGRRDPSGSFLGRIDLSTHKRTLYKYQGGRGGLFGIVSLDGDLWMTDSDNKIDRFDTTTHVIHARSLPQTYGGLFALAVGADQQLWFPDVLRPTGGTAIGKLCPDLSSDRCATSP